MPAKKNTKAKASTDSKPEIKEKRRNTAATRRGHPQAKGRSSMEQNDREREIDEELALTFLTEYHVFEQAVLRAGFTRAGRTPGSIQVDWGRFARHVEPQFKPDSSAVLQGAVAYLLYNHANRELREERQERPLPWEIAGPHSDVAWLSELVQQTRNKLSLGINFPGSPACDTALVMAALFVMEALAHLDPQVESLLTSVL